jgi:hypothetical protein
MFIYFAMAKPYSLDAQWLFLYINPTPKRVRIKCTAGA